MTWPVIAVEILGSGDLQRVGARQQRTGRKIATGGADDVELAERQLVELE